MADSNDKKPEGSGTTPPPGVKLVPLAFQISIPDLRNGSLINIQQAAPKASMSVLYHWPIITGLPSDRAIDAVSFSVRATYAQFVHALGTSITPVLEAENRKKSIVLAAIRAGAHAAYKLAPADLTRSELTPSGMEMSDDRIGQTANGTTASARWTIAQSMAELVPLEEQVIGVCVYMGMAVPVLQGVSLVMTGHHYIPTTYNLFKGIKRQALGSATPDVRAWIEGMGETFDDMAFHKAIHPMSPTLKRSLSKQVDVASRLRASGHGSAAIRLPAVPSEASGGKAMIALIKAAKPTFSQMGHTITADAGEQLMFQLEHAAEGQPEADACDRVVSWIAAHAQDLAFCAGIVQQVHETSGTSRNTILSAYSVKRVMADNAAEVSKGVMYARAASSLLRRAMEEGAFPDPQLSL